MRDIINKGLTEEDIINGAVLAFKGGWTKVKLYFMLGLPFEQDEDIEGIAKLCNSIAAAFYEAIPKDQRVNGRVNITASTSFFIPKPFTPFQWAAQGTKEEFLEKARFVNSKMKEKLNSKSIKYNWHDAGVSVLEGALARGDRRLSRVLVSAYKKGACFDAWTETFHEERWLEAFEETGVSLDFYTKRERDTSELLPWDFIDTGISREFLIREWENARDERVTLNCRRQCAGCGARAFGGGVCYED